MGWNDDNRAALWSAPIQAGVGAGLMYGAAPLSAALAVPTGGLSLALAPLMWGAGAGLIGSGAGTAIGAGLDIAGSDPEKVYISKEVQDIIDRGNQAGVMQQLLAPHIQARMKASNPYAGTNPYTAARIVGNLTGDASSVAAGVAQIPANFAEEIESWYKNRGNAQKQQWDDVVRMYQEQAALADYANKVYLNAQQLESDVRRGNQENELDRSELAQARIRVGGKIGSKIAGAIGGAFKPKFPETMEDLTKSSSGWLKGMRSTSSTALTDGVREPIIPSVPAIPDVSVGAPAIPDVSVNYDTTGNKFLQPYGPFFVPEAGVPDTTARSHLPRAYKRFSSGADYGNQLLESYRQLPSYDTDWMKNTLFAPDVYGVSNERIGALLNTRARPAYRIYGRDLQPQITPISGSYTLPRDKSIWPVRLNQIEPNGPYVHGPYAPGGK